jgi:hypothetical protein
MADRYALALQKALVAKLKSDADVAALVGARIYDHPPQDATRPYIRIGGIEPRPVRTDGKAAANLTFGIEAHSRPVTSGRVEATKCAEAIVTALDDATLTVTGYDVVQVHWQTQTVAQDSDGQSYTAIVAFDTLLDG